jgi:hypothetical protein
LKYCKLNLIERNTFLDSKNISLFAVEQKNGFYKCSLWVNDTFKSIGSIEYKTKHDAINETSKIIYEKITNK